MPIPEITVQELADLRRQQANFLLLDVRNPDEYEHYNLQGKLIPLSELPSRLNELDPEQHIIIHCHAGGRSARATDFLLKNGFTNVYNLQGGVLAWIKEMDK